MKDIIKIVIGLVIVALLVLSQGDKNNSVVGSIDDGGAYTSTTTDSSWNTPAQSTSRFKLLKTGPGILGSILINNETAGSFTLYDATTTATTTRMLTEAGAIATSTLAKVYASMAEGTYVYDTAFTWGLIAEFQSSNVASSTITFK